MQFCKTVYQDDLIIVKTADQVKFFEKKERMKEKTENRPSVFENRPSVFQNPCESGMLKEVKGFKAHFRETTGLLHRAGNVL